MVSLKAIEKSRNISILTDNDSFGDASALYTYILRLHKKVSLVTTEKKLNMKLSCIPWHDKVKKILSASSDLIIDLRENKEDLYDLFKKNSVIINVKMATALYASYLQKTDCYSEKNIHALSELIFLKADYEECNLYLKKSLPLSLFRLKAVLFEELILYDNAKTAVMGLKENDLKKTGASMYEVELVMREALNINHVQNVVVVDEKNENRLVRII